MAEPLMIYRITVDFYGIKKYRCPTIEIHEHLPHFWYDSDQMRRYFCRGR